MERAPDKRPNTSDPEDSDDEARKRKIERWRNEGNVQVIPTNAGRRSRLNHRQVGPGNLRPALRTYATEEARMDRNRGNLVPYGDIDQRKSLPTPPGSGLYGDGFGPGSCSPPAYRPMSPPLFSDLDRQRLSMSPPNMAAQQRLSRMPFAPDAAETYGRDTSMPNSFGRPGEFEQLTDRRQVPRGMFSLSNLKSSLPPLGLGRLMGLGDRTRNSRARNNNDMYGYPGASMRNLNDLLPGGPGSKEQRLILPADNLRDYLSDAVIPKWTRWQDPDVDTGGSRWQNRDAWGTGDSYAMGRRICGIGAGANVGRDSGKEQVLMRLLDAVSRHARDAEQKERRLCSWSPRSRFLDAVLESFEKSVPRSAIEVANRWGEQVFAVSANGFDTVLFTDPAWDRAEDGGLLGWLKGAVLQTAVSALHMLRYNAQNFTFMILPESVAPRRTGGQGGRHHFAKAGVKSAIATELPDGCGTFVLANKASSFDRAMVLLVRPPWLVDEGVLQAFVKEQRDWRASRRPELPSEAGIAELLQCQAYDDCVANHCFFFCVTTLKYWVFGHFNPDFSRCAYSPIIERKSSDPSVMAILVTWMLRAVDERPREFDPDLSSRPISPPQSPAASMRRRGLSHDPNMMRQSNVMMQPGIEYGSFVQIPGPGFARDRRTYEFDNGLPPRAHMGPYGMPPPEELMGPAYETRLMDHLGRHNRGHLLDFGPGGMAGYGPVQNMSMGERILRAQESRYPGQAFGNEGGLASGRQDEFGRRPVMGEGGYDGRGPSAMYNDDYDTGRVNRY